MAAASSAPAAVAGRQRCHRPAPVDAASSFDHTIGIDPCSDSSAFILADHAIVDEDAAVLRAEAGGHHLAAFLNHHFVLFPIADGQAVPPDGTYREQVPVTAHVVAVDADRRPAPDLVEDIAHSVPLALPHLELEVHVGFRPFVHTIGMRSDHTRSSCTSQERTVMKAVRGTTGRPTTRSRCSVAPRCLASAPPCYRPAPRRALSATP